MASESKIATDSDEPDGLNVLVVEDDDDAREIMCDILSLHGHRVSTRRSCADAFKIPHLAGFDVIILDRKLPDGMVEEQLPMFRQFAAGTDLIVVTGYADMNASIAAMREGVNDYIIKPIEPEALLRSLQHIARRREIERDLRREQHFAEMVLETSEAIILVLDTRGRITRFNQYLTNLTGRTLEEVEDHDWFDTFIPEHDRARLRELFELTISETGSRGVLNPIMTKSGEEKEIRWSNSVIKEPSGRVTGVLSVGLDVTDLIAAQEKARQSDRLATIGQTMTGMAHESRNALQRIRNSVELLEDEVGDNPEALRYLEKISRAGHDLQDLLEEVRAYAAPIRLDLERVSLPTIWRRAWECLEEKSEQATLLELPNNEQTPPALVDSRRLGQVFRNLFENSFDACGPGVEVSICTEAAEDELRIKIRDNGPGMPPDARAKIFEAFYTTKPTGTGLGMAIVHRIIEAHGGSISLTDASPGTEFLIRLPATGCARSDAYAEHAQQGTS